MLSRLPSVFLWPLLLGAVLLARCTPAPPETAAAPPPVAAPAVPLPTLEYPQPGESVSEAVQERIVLPFGTPVPTDTSQVVVQFNVGTWGSVQDVRIRRGLGPGVDEAVRAALQTDDLFGSPQPIGRDELLPCTLTIQAPGASSAAQRREAVTRWQRSAHRLPGETDSAFVQRVLPVSFAGYEPSLLAVAWRPSAFGKQLFFARRGGYDNEYGTDLYVLDPYQPATYAVQVLPIPSMGDLTNLHALFLADANHAGRRDLLLLAECSLRETHIQGGDTLDGHWPHYATGIWQYAGPDKAGRPQYREDHTPRPYLDELGTAADVRRALARHKK
jgi:hypothetical protein